MKEKIIELLREACALEEKRITAKTKLKDLSLDSLSFIEFLVHVEEEFGIEFDDEELYIGKWEGIEDIIFFVERKINDKYKNSRHKAF